MDVIKISIVLVRLAQGTVCGILHAMFRVGVRGTRAVCIGCFILDFNPYWTDIMDCIAFAFWVCDDDDFQCQVLKVQCTGYRGVLDI